MGMDLKPVAPSEDAPLRNWGSEENQKQVEWGRYNWAGWAWLIEHLIKWNFDVSEFSGVNDGEMISNETCLKVADAIEEHLPELDDIHREWMAPHVKLWRTCGGYLQY